MIKLKMKLTLAFILIVGLLIIYSSSTELKSSHRRSQRQVQGRSIFTRTRQNRQLSNLLRIPSIICHYAKYGRWPEYNPRLRRLVLQFSRIVFSMSDESVRLYCNQVYQLNQFFRPSGSPRETPTVFNAVNPTTRALTPNLPPPFVPASQTTTTFRPPTSTVSIIFPGITPSTTTTASPTATGSGTGTATASGQASVN